MTSDLVIGMAGSGGDGIVAAGESLITAASLEGYYAIMTKSFGSQIRGGESSCRLRIATQQIYSTGGTLDVAVALNWEDFLKFGLELPVGGHTVVIYDSRTGVPPDRIPLPGVRPAASLPIPIAEIAKANAGTDRAKNTVVLGLLAGWFGIARDAILAGIRKRFEKKGPEVVEANHRTFIAGIEYTSQNPLPAAKTISRPIAVNGAKMLADGNEMCGAAAIFAGCEFFSGYPITPSSETMHYLGSEIWKYGGTMLQAEDEIAGIGAVVGASFAGKKAMTMTSGPGLSLKAEILGLATIAELPMVCVDVQRGGPSTGIPTKSEQSDLFAAVFSAHGDVVRPVLAPMSVADTFAVTVEAFNIAEQYQTPVIVLSDQDLAQRKETVALIDTAKFRIVERRRPTEAELSDYSRYRFTETGISPISQPGMPHGNYLASGIEHNEHGAPTASGEMHAKMNEKRIRKLAPLKSRRDMFLNYGDPDAPVGIISWGSVAGVAIEAFQAAQGQGLNVKLLIPRLIYPVAEFVYKDFFSSVRKGLVVEQSHQGQLHRILRMFVDVPDGMESLAKSGSNPILAREIVERLRIMILSLHRKRKYEPEPELG